MAASTWKASHAFTKEYGNSWESGPAVLAGEDPDPADSIHQALLTVTAGPAGIDGAYCSL